MSKALAYATLMLVTASITANAQVYPDRPITIVVPVSAGGPTDALARTVAERMSSSLGQRVLVENVTGAAGNIGVSRVARANPVVALRYE